MFAMQETNQEVTELLSMLTYMRPGGSETEELFLDRFVRPLAEHQNVTQFKEDASGNLFFQVSGGSPLLVTSHSDTVHHEPGMQEVIYDPTFKYAYKSDKRPLGADDGAGVWLCTEIIKAGTPCWVAIFRMEERGGIGSTTAADTNPEFFKQFRHCISLDRRGTEDVITHQAAGRCCSDAFAWALSDALNEHGLNYSPCDGGVFTDSANLTHLIPECTNLSIAYFNEHSGEEMLDIGHLTALRDTLVAVDWEALPTEREAKKETYGFGNWNRAGFGSDVDDVMQMSYSKLKQWIKESSPDDIADVIFDLTDRVFAAQDEAYYDQEAAFEKQGWDDEEENNHGL